MKIYTIIKIDDSHVSVRRFIWSKPLQLLVCPFTEDHIEKGILKVGSKVNIIRYTEINTSYTYLKPLNT